MLIRGEAVVPPGCPAITGTGADIATAPVYLYIHEAGAEGSEVTEAFFSFGRSDDGGAIVTDSLIIPFKSEASLEANNLKDRHLLEPGKVEAEVRAAFCERVANCQGVRNGVCGALGAEAVESVINQLSN